MVLGWVILMQFKYCPSDVWDKSGCLVGNGWGGEYWTWKRSIAYSDLTQARNTCRYRHAALYWFLNGYIFVHKVLTKRLQLKQWDSWSRLCLSLSSHGRSLESW